MPCRAGHRVTQGRLAPVRPRSLRAGPRSVSIGAFVLGLAQVLAQVAPPPANPVLPSEATLLPPIGPYAPAREADFAASTTWSAKDRLVCTPYFYWYDVFSGEHLIDVDGTDALTDHPASLTGFSYRSKAWHKSQLADMTAAGIDIAMPVYWGEPSARKAGQPVADQAWSFAGIPPLVAAREELEAEQRNPPRLALFYDTSTLQFNVANERIDLTTPRGREWFYESIRDFFSLVPPRHWAMIDGHPVLFLYSAAFAARHDPSCLEYLRDAFARDFAGRTPFVVREVSWNVPSAQVYAWGGALGFKNPGVASLGPGYDHSAVPGREPLIVPREGGAYFERLWNQCLRRPSQLVMIETWNEFHEGTEIAHSREYGRQYLDLNRHYADLFRSGYIPPPPVGPFTDARLVQIELGPTNQPSGLLQIESADGVTQPATRGGRTCRITRPTEHGPRYVYFKVDESFKWAESMDVLIVLEIFAGARGTLRIEFDGSDPTAPFHGAYSSSGALALNGDQTWRTLALPLSQARFLNSQNAGADLRVSVGDLEIGLRRVQILREGLKAMRFDPDLGCELQLYAEPGRLYDLESSDNLASWQNLVRVQPSETLSRHVDASGRREALRWYRLRRAGL